MTEYCEGVYIFFGGDILRGEESEDMMRLVELCTKDSDAVSISMELGTLDPSGSKRATSSECETDGRPIKEAALS
jgi:hypothetical protein